LEIKVEDNGIGLSPDNLTPQGNGQGLALHSTMMAIVGGTLATESLPGHYSRIILSLPEGNYLESSGSGD
jgi:glucose-6-phosphate-specific signal transduction histidine kinase